jgi:hypothetical protein
MIMNQADTEVRILQAFYDSLEIRLEEQYQNLEARHLVLMDGEVIEEKLFAAEKRIARFVSNCNPAAGILDGARVGNESSAVFLHERCRTLLKLIERNAAALHRLRGEISASLQGLRAGGRFLRSVRPYRELQPKFIDARH